MWNPNAVFVVCVALLVFALNWPRGGLAALVCAAGLSMPKPAAAAVPAALRPAVEAFASIQPGQVAASAGMPGTGKTASVKAACDRFPRVVVFDPYARRDRQRVAAGKSHRVVWSGDLASTLDVVLDPSVLDAERLRLVVHPDSLNKAEMGRQFSVLADLCWETGDLVLVGEEAGLYSRSAVDLIHRIASGGAHAGMSMILVSQSISRLNVDARRGIGILAIGAQGESGDIDDVRSRCGKKFAERVRALRGPEPGRPPDAPLVWRLGEGVKESS